MSRKESSLPFENRVEKILKYLSTNNSITVDTVASLCGVSRSTARTQLGEMHNRGMLTRTHGGAIKKTENTPSVNISIPMVTEKDRIAAAAAGLIVPGDIIAIGGGPTGLCLARALKAASDIVVVTDSIYIATELQFNHNIELHISGGILRTNNGSCSGVRAEDFFRTITATKSFIGADSVDASGGFTVMNPDERTERALLCCAKTRVVIVDHTKFSKGPYVDHLASFADVDLCITDRGISRQHLEMLQSNGVEVMTV